MPGLTDRANIEAFLNAHEVILESTFLSVGEEVGVWRVLAFLGRGGNGEVYRVAHKQLGIIAALKVLTRDDDAARNRFRREARILAENSHPALPRFLGYDESERCAYLVIELLEELPLPRSDRQIAKYLCQVCEGVAFLHSLGLVHRDIKPDNIMISHNTIKLIDFSISFCEGKNSVILTTPRGGPLSTQPSSLRW